MTTLSMRSQTKSSLERHLAQLESQSCAENLRARLLWPTTPIGEEIQNQIQAMVGVSDLEAETPRSRPAIVLSIVRRLIEDGDLPQQFSLLDVPCGDARILMEVKRNYPEARCFGIDCHVGRFEAHAAAIEQGVCLHGGYLQDLFAQPVPEILDLVMMLNTFRGWQHANLQSGDSDLPRRVEKWFVENARFAILTADPGQIDRLKKTHSVEDWGKGEENSRFILLRFGTRPKELSPSEGAAT